MRSERTITVDREHSRSLVVQYPQPGGPLVIRNSDLAVIPPRPLPLTLKAQRSFAKVTKFGVLAAICAFCGYAYRDTGIRRAIDYRLTMLTTSGVPAVLPSHASHSPNFEPLPAQARHLFADNQKGPRADKFAYALKAGGFEKRVQADQDRSAEFAQAAGRCADGGARGCRAFPVRIHAARPLA